MPTTRGLFVAAVAAVVIFDCCVAAELEDAASILVAHVQSRAQPNDQLWSRYKAAWHKAQEPASATKPNKVPNFKWSQRKGTLSIAVHIPGIDQERVEIEAQSVTVVALSDKEQPYKLQIKFLHDIVPEKSTHRIDAGRSWIYMSITKRSFGPYWPRLMDKKPTGELKRAMDVDWKNWLDEEDDTSEEGVDERFVKVLGADNFDDWVGSQALGVVEFYAPWCGHCKQLRPEYARAGEMLDQQGSVAKLAKVDATEHPGLASRFDVTGYPTLKIFRRGSAFEFKGGRTASEITEYLTKQAEPAVKRYSNKLMSHAQPFLVLFSGDEPTKLMFERLAEALRDEYEFADSNSPDDFGATAGSIVLLKPNFSELDQSRVVFSTGLSASDHEANKKAVVEFMNKHAYPLVTDTMDGGKYKQDATWESALRKRGYPMVLLFVDSTEGSDSSQQEMKDALAVANAHLGEFSFVRLDGLRDSERLVSFGLTKRLPQVVLEDGSEHYGMEGSKIDQESLSKFIADFKAGSLTRSIRSEEPPSSNNEPVTVVVGKTFDTIVKDDRKNVMIEFYAPWCGHCQQLAPTYEKLGAKYKANDSVVVAKMDASANEVPDSSYKVEGFPTLLFKPAGAASPLEYQGDRELDALAKFIDQNSK